MKRVNVSPKGFYVAYVDLPHVLDAKEWCDNHCSEGRYNMSWGITQQTENSITYDSEIRGIFEFSSADDHLLFTLKWA